MNAGKELDGLIEERVFSFKWSEGRCRICGWPLAKDVKDGCIVGNCSLRPRPVHNADEPTPFSTDIHHAFRVVERISRELCDFSLEKSGLKWTASWPGFVGTARTPEHAICLAALEFCKAKV